MRIFENSWLNIKRGIDKPMFYATVLLFLLGIVAIYSAGYSMENQNSPYVMRQLMFGVAGFAGYFIILKIGYKKMLAAAIPLSAMVVVMFLLLLVIGHTSKGAQSWFNLGFIRIQPSEIGKIAYALLLAKFCTLIPPHDKRGIGLAFGLSALFLVPIILQPDLGSALVYSVMLLSVLALASAPLKLIISLIAAGFAMLPAVWFMLKPYQRMRLLVFVDPTVDPQGAGYNVIQSRIAVGSGGFFGKGFLHGTQAKLHFLPEPHTDFIFGVFAEEFGFIGCSLVLFLFGLLMWQMISIATRVREPDARLLCISITAWIWFQMTESIAMCMGLAPVTGLPLPLFSYGGSSLVAVLLGLAIVQSIAIEYNKEHF